MITKQIFSKKRNPLCEVVFDKAFNKNVCEKSFIRGSSSVLDTTLILDNNSNLSNLNLLKKKVTKKVSGEFSPGKSLCTSTFFYKNKKNNGLRFKSHILNFGHCENLLDSSYNLFKSSKFPDKTKDSTLLILKAVKGGFKCYSSGRIGFLPRFHGFFFSIASSKLLNKLTPLKNLYLSYNFYQFYRQNLLYHKNTGYFFGLIKLRFISGRIRHKFQLKGKGFSLTRRKKLLRKQRKLFQQYNFVFLNKEKELLERKKKAKRLKLKLAEQ
jgi:hypothetical protein